MRGGFGAEKTKDGGCTVRTPAAVLVGGRASAAVLVCLRKESGLIKGIREKCRGRWDSGTGEDEGKCDKV